MVELTPQAELRLLDYLRPDALKGRGWVDTKSQDAGDVLAQFNTDFPFGNRRGELEKLVGYLDYKLNIRRIDPREITSSGVFFAKPEMGDKMAEMMVARDTNSMPVMHYQLHFHKDDKPRIDELVARRVSELQAAGHTLGESGMSTGGARAI